MKIIKKLALVLVVLITLLLIGSLIIPGQYHVERGVVIDAPPEAVFPFVNQVKLWPAWIAWTAAKDPTLVNTFSGPESGVGATLSWEGKKLGRTCFPKRCATRSGSPSIALLPKEPSWIQVVG